MKTAFKPVILLLFGILLIASGCSKGKSTSWKSFKSPEVVSQLKSFVSEKEAQANASTNAVVPGYASFFAAAQKGDWLAVNHAFKDFRNHAGQYEHSGKTDERLRGTKWQAVMEVWGTLDSMAEGNEKYSTLYANEIINSIPSGSVYFGGTDPGRFLITGMEKSQVNGDPFFLITQNALADSTYLDYVRSMYGDRLYIPTSADSQKCFQDYSEDAQKRLKEGQLKPGENVSVDPQSGRVQVTGQIAVMEINALLAKIIFDQNSNYDCYIEQSFPLDWMYPYLEPHEMILKLDRQRVAGLSDTIVQQDHDYWTNLIQPMIGDWLNDSTSVQEIADFGKKVFRQHDLSGFTGDPQFVQNDYSCKMFSKERSNIAGLFAWRAAHSTNDAERERMIRATDFAYRQALALCPSSPEAIYGYVNFLQSQNRSGDAAIVLEMKK
ncbi:MAG TPA: hypothetical protein VGI03_13575 [Verrucomicrobiae bacterium]|jgi:hypothetical protein